MWLLSFTLPHCPPLRLLQNLCLHPRWECSTSHIDTVGPVLYSLAPKIVITIKVSLIGLKMYHYGETTKKDMLLPGAPGWLSLSTSDSWFRLRSQSRGCGIESCTGLCVPQRVCVRFSFPLPGLPPVSFSLSKYINKILKRKRCTASG